MFMIITNALSLTKHFLKFYVIKGLNNIIFGNGIVMKCILYEPKVYERRTFKRV